MLEMLFHPPQATSPPRVQPPRVAAGNSLRGAATISLLLLLRPQTRHSLLQLESHGKTWWVRKALAARSR